ncbi:MAG: alpha/beta fold hydrolase [Leptolyngbyaceae cyanobacterium SM1_1_3]|nr:alpha/beta fold hydrolase [Leptolyngbyaceae cyanobacterium SM1_1_3]NJM85263.1 alpha/beta fold hydrolase [Leptolyngbyaceae cyanobacterium RM2_2_21]NJN01400.1 alpha/beta fold hydrolase [Leptolyngbyaceae cyanobacterium RM1_1_2]NJO11159.1 alpha/beta fold hydrolase [Leptolyngbyaceae cyanobacterium SL_1_1]
MVAIETGNQSSSSQGFGNQRIWFWRGWRIRYTYLRPASPAAAAATPILLLHGFGASLQQWRDNLLPLSQHHPIYALDLLGFGASEKAATRFGTDLWVEQVIDFWQTWLGRPVILLGHSLGALVALAATTTHPEMVDRLIMLTLPAARQELLTGWSGQWASRFEDWFSTPLLIRPLFQLAQRSWLIRAVLRSIYTRPERVDADLVASFVRPAAERGAARTLMYLVKSRTDERFSPATQDLLLQVRVPTLLLWGQADRVIPISWGRQVAGLNAVVELQELPQLGHCLYDECPEQVNQAICGWLAI